MASLYASFKHSYIAVPTTYRLIDPTIRDVVILLAKSHNIVLESNTHQFRISLATNGTTIFVTYGSSSSAHRVPDAIYALEKIYPSYTLVQDVATLTSTAPDLQRMILGQTKGGTYIGQVLNKTTNTNTKQLFDKTCLLPITLDEKIAWIKASKPAFFAMNVFVINRTRNGINLVVAYNDVQVIWEASIKAYRVRTRDTSVRRIDNEIAYTYAKNNYTPKALIKLMETYFKNTTLDLVSTIQVLQRRTNCTKEHINTYIATILDKQLALLADIGTARTDYEIGQLFTVVLYIGDTIAMLVDTNKITTDTATYQTILKKYNDVIRALDTLDSLIPLIRQEYAMVRTLLLL